MSKSPFEFVNSINSKGDHLMVQPEDEKDYVPFLTNRSLSYFYDTAVLANEMNRWRNLDNRLQYDFLRKTVRQKKRFSKWNKPETLDHIELVKEYYGYSSAKAASALRVLPPEQLEKIERILSRGGRQK